MAHFEGRYDEYEREVSARRILEDGDFIRRGATIGETGGLVLGKVGLEYLNLTENLIRPGIGVVDRTEAEHTPQDEWLDTRIDEAWARHDISGNKALNALQGAKLTSLRDIFVIGKRGVGSIRNLGNKAADEVNSVVADNEFQLPWEDQPTPETIATFCPRLSQVTAFDLELGRLSRPTSVLGVLDTPLEERAALFGQNRHNLDVYRQDILYNYPEVFAVRFTYHQLMA